ncbi:hypothetical protein Barb6_01865 [Bacteroidales bacterium Barb6]|nr:hypothetical protein Barb6_01865 [Bacteroidales bacterium Barb6]
MNALSMLFTIYIILSLAFIVFLKTDAGKKWVDE